MLDNTFVEALQDSVKPQLLTDAKGRQYSSHPLNNLPFAEQPRFPKIELHTLDGLVDYIKGNRDGAATSEQVQITCYARAVNLLGKPEGELRQRDHIVQVNCLVPEFSGALSFTDVESFRITLLTRFEESPDRNLILKFISSVQDEAIKTQQDDGVSQRVTVKVGVGTMESAIVPSPVGMAPLRTFTEIEQPTSQFIFRMQKSDKGPQAGLFAIADDWQARAAIDVKNYLKKELGDSFAILA